jgi:S-adenosylmethionine hydrolase
LRGVKRSYSEVAIGDALLLIDSNGFLELSMNQDHCASRLGLRVGDRIEIEV